MMRHLPKRGIWPLATVGGLFLVSGVTSAAAQMTWYWYYAQGLQHLQRHNYQKAIRSFEEALKLRSEPSARARTRGMFFREYFPYFQLARAYFALGDIETAAQMLKRELAAGEIQKKKDFFARAQALRAQIEARLKPPPPPVAEKPVSEPSREKVPPPEPAPAEKPEPLSPPVQPPPKPSPGPLPMPRVVVLQAWKFYAQSDYRRMIALLEQNLKEYSGNDTVYFLLSCAYAAQYFLSGEANSIFLEKAREYYSRVQRIPPRIQRRLDILVSPKIRRLLRPPQGE